LIEDITERKIAEAKINHLARFDALTGLPNRTVLRDRMERALDEWRADNMCAIHFIDLDQFKQVNDTLGHTRGNMLLEAVAERLRSSIRDADVISRFGGDEFVILQSPIRSIEQAEALATRVLNALGGTYDLDGHKVVVTASIGIALAKSRIDPEQLLRNADIALYQAKSDGRGTWRWFESKMEASAQARRALEFDLRSATESDAFDLDFQPIFNLKTRRIETCEALLRWPHHERGIVSPGEFIPVAEEMGLIVEIGNQVLYKALPGMPALARRHRGRSQSFADSVRALEYSGAGAGDARRYQPASAPPRGRDHRNHPVAEHTTDAHRSAAARRNWGEDLLG
jgi:diguanylate cyclase (GGDEF)-like protein